MPKRTPEEIAQMILDSAYGDESDIESLSDEEDGIPVAMTVPVAPSEVIENETQDKELEPPPKKLRKKWKNILEKNEVYSYCPCRRHKR